MTSKTVNGYIPSTIPRELRRNRTGGQYEPGSAHVAAWRRRYYAKKAVKMTPQVRLVIEEKLRKDWAPEQISGWMKKTGQEVQVSHQRIYDYAVRDRLNSGRLYLHLHHRHKPRRKRKGKPEYYGLIKGRIGIEERPAIVEEKARLGDWEMDTIIGANHKGALVSLVERCSKYTLIAGVPTKHAQPIAEKVIDLLKPIKDAVHTLTVDNGKEFADHQNIANALDAKVYFAHPYSPWQRGLSENTNGLIGQYFPKKKYLASVQQSEIDVVIDKLNNRPRKPLNCDTPTQKFEKMRAPQTHQPQIALQS